MPSAPTDSGLSAARKISPHLRIAAARFSRASFGTDVSESTFLHTVRSVDSTSITEMCHAPSMKVAMSFPCPAALARIAASAASFFAASASSPSFPSAAFSASFSIRSPSFIASLPALYILTPLLAARR